MKRNGSQQSTKWHFLVVGLLVTASARATDVLPVGIFVAASTKFAFIKPTPGPCDVVMDLAILDENEVRLEDRLFGICETVEPPPKNSRTYKVTKSHDFFCGTAYETSDRHFFFNDYRNGPQRCFDPLPGDPPSIKTDFYLQEIGEEIHAASAMTCRNCPKS